jgi:hypothetical protein
MATELISEEDHLVRLAAVGRAMSGKDQHPQLKYIKGDWAKGSGDSTQELPPGTRVTARPGDARAEWRNFSTKRSVSVPIDQAHTLPSRASLGDTDPNFWDLDSSGQRKDPWVGQLCVDVLYEGETFTISMASLGGRQAIGSLIEEYAKAPEARDGRLPIIELCSTAYIHKVYGKVKVPVLRIVAWTAGFAESCFAEQSSTAKLINDDIPF